MNVDRKPDEFTLTTAQWTELINWIPANFLSEQFTFVVFDEWDSNRDQVKQAIRDKYPMAEIITLAEERKSGLSTVGACAIINPQWADPEMKVGGGQPLKKLAPELFEQYSSLLVVGKNTRNDPALLLLEQAALMSPNPVERVQISAAPGSSLYCITLRSVPPVQSTSFKDELALGAAAAAGGGSASAAAAAAATAGRGRGLGRERP